MKCMLLLAVLSAFALAQAQAGKVTIKGSCIDCNEPSTTVKPSHKTAEKSTKAARKHISADHQHDNDSSAEASWVRLNLDSAEGTRQHILRPRRQWFPPGGRVIDASRFPGTVLHNDDCVGCNIRGG